MIEMEKIIQGLGVSQGKAQGRVKIIHTPEDFSKFSEGNILVVKITNPNLVLLMGKAAGIICDIGGMTSHPSIVSREMGIPCIVSAKCVKMDRSATEVLKDGMIIEMCGESGEVHMIEEERHWIDEFLGAVTQGLVGMDFSTLKPIDCFEMFPLYAKEGSKRLLNIIEASTKYDIREIAQHMHSPSVIRVEMLLALVKARIAKADKNTLMKIAEFYSSLLQAICLEDHYTKNGKNIVHKSEEIRKIIKNLKVADPEIAKKLGQLSNACYHLAYSLYSDINPQICYDNFGPYDASEFYGSGHILVVKQFQNLKPVELWGDKIKDFPLDRIRVYCIYQNVDFSVDNASHTQYKGDVINGLKYFGVEVDGKFVEDLSLVKEATNKMGLKSVEIWQALNALNFESAKVKFLEQRCYNYVALCQKLGLNWRPTTEMLEAVKEKTLVKDFWPVLDAESVARFWKIMIDPRIGSVEFEQHWNEYKNQPTSP